MSKQTDSSFLIHSSMPRFYQQLLSGIETYQALGNRIIRQIEAAHAFRQVEQVKELARILINFPIKEHQLIAQYYFVWSESRRSHYDTATLERIVEQTQTYKAKALISRAAFEVYRGDTCQALYFYAEALRTNPTLPDYIKASTGIATVKASEGFHYSALSDLENLLPLLRHAKPLNFFEVANSYAVELGEVGRVEEARNVIRNALASPFALVYPECQETAGDLREPSRMFISVPQIERQPVEVQPIQSRHVSKEARPNRPRRLIPFPPLKEVPKPDRPHRVTPQEFDHMTADERAELVLAAVRSGDVKENDYIRLVIALGLLDSGPISKVIDLEDESLLNDIISVWCNMIEPEEFAAVMSALRDCKDDQRRAEIIDTMIAIAFKQTCTSMQTEQEWRMRVERKLPEK